MKRFVCLIIVCALLCVFSIGVFATDDTAGDFDFGRIALLSMTSSAEGSNINYFIMRPVICHTDAAGETDGTMFDSVILDIGFVPKTPVEAESFITSLFTKGANLDAIENVVADLKDGKFVPNDYKYPVFVSMPYFYGLFKTLEERNEFCNYFVITLLSVLKMHEFKNLYIAGFCFGIEYDAVPDFRSNCVTAAKENGFKTIALTTVSGVSDVDACFAANENIGRKLSLGEDYNGVTLKLAGVPSDKDSTPLDNLKNDFVRFKNSSIKNKAVVFTFSAFNDLYDCAAGLDETIPNEPARDAYNFVSDIVAYTGVEEESSDAEESIEISNDQSDSDITDETWFWVVIAVPTVAVISACVAVFVVKGKKNGKQ